MNRGITPQSPKAKLLNAALSLIREKGYSSTSVEELCAQASVTKGAFFHYFKCKDALAVAAANHWSAITGAFFETAPYHKHSDPLDRVLGYLDFRQAILKGEIAEAMKRYRIRAPRTAESLALHTQAVLQGAFVLAKAKGGAAIAAASIDHLHRYIELLFQPARRNRKETS